LKEGPVAKEPFKRPTWLHGILPKGDGAFSRLFGRERAPADAAGTTQPSSQPLDLPMRTTAGAAAPRQTVARDLRHAQASALLQRFATPTPAPEPATPSRVLFGRSATEFLGVAPTSTSMSDPTVTTWKRLVERKLTHIPRDIVDQVRNVNQFQALIAFQKDELARAPSPDSSSPPGPARP
jgi:hypothetical protein